MDFYGRGLTVLAGRLFRSPHEKMHRILYQGIFRLWPGRIRSLCRPLAALILATEEPLFRAMEDRVSPLATVYLVPEDFLDAVLEEVVFFFAELPEEVLFLGADEVLDGVTFFVPLKA